MMGGYFNGVDGVALAKLLHALTTRSRRRRKRKTPTQKGAPKPTIKVAGPPVSEGSSAGALTLQTSKSPVL